MATPELIAELRRMIDESDETNYTDVDLNLRIDATGATLNSVAAGIWREKAASYAGLVDITEGNSSRKLSSLYAQALKMAAAYEPDSTTDTGAATGKRFARMRPIERV